MKNAIITQTNGNTQNGIKGSRLTIKSADGVVIDQFVVPKHNAREYCEQYKGGVYGKRFAAAVEKAEK